jgi:hypothetical protein
MAVADPAKASVNLPDDYVLAIGKVCVAWNHLEGLMEISIAKLAGFGLSDPRSKILVNHMAWPMRVDIFAALCDHLVPDYPHLGEYQKVVTLLKKAQEGRNHIVHNFWGIENGKVTALRATARGKLKLTMQPVTLDELAIVLDDIYKAAAALYNLVAGT